MIAPLARRQRSKLVEDRARDRAFADVVQPGRQLELEKRVDGEAEAAPDAERELGDLGGVSLEPVVA